LTLSESPPLKQLSRTVMFADSETTNSGNT